MSTIRVVHGSCADQNVDAVVNAANRDLWAGGGICGVIFRKAGAEELAEACAEHATPLRDGEAVITPAFRLRNARYIIHAVGPNFSITPDAFRELFDAYYNSLVILMENGLHSISFPLISAGIFGGHLAHAAAESAKQCYDSYQAFVKAYPDYTVDVCLCAFSDDEYEEVRHVCMNLS